MTTNGCFTVTCITNSRYTVIPINMIPSYKTINSITLLYVYSWNNSVVNILVGKLTIKQDYLQQELLIIIDHSLSLYSILFDFHTIIQFIHQHSLAVVSFILF